MRFADDKAEGGHSGLTKREWFAGLAMQGIVSVLTRNYADGFIAHHAGGVATIAVAYADALIQELAKEPK